MASFVKSAQWQAAIWTREPKSYFQHVPTFLFSSRLPNISLKYPLNLVFPKGKKSPKTHQQPSPNQKISPSAAPGAEAALPEVMFPACAEDLETWMRRAHACRATSATEANDVARERSGVGVGVGDGLFSGVFGGKNV